MIDIAKKGIPEGWLPVSSSSQTEDLEAFWGMLAAGTCTTSSVPKGRWDPAEWVDSDPTVPNKAYTSDACWLPDADLFDAGFFKIKKGEATAMDPKQRLLLETCYSSFHEAGYDKASLFEKNIGVYVGLCSNDWPLVTEHQKPVAAVAATTRGGARITTREI